MQREIIGQAVGVSNVYANGVYVRWQLDSVAKVTVVENGGVVLHTSVWGLSNKRNSVQFNSVNPYIYILGV